MEFELSLWEDGVHLVHWDRLHGQDIDILLADDGKAYLEGYDDDGLSFRTLINVVVHLRHLAMVATTTPPEEE